MIEWDGRIPAPSRVDRREARAALRRCGAAAAGLADVKAIERGVALLLWPLGSAVRSAARELAARGRMDRVQIVEAIGTIDPRTRRMWRVRCRELVDRVVVESLVLEHLEDVL
jgi:hypothetical protein